MEWLHTWSGRSLGYRDGDDLRTHDGRHVGKFQGDEVFDKNGKYLGELCDGRLIKSKSKKSIRGASFTPYAKMCAHVNYVDYIGYVMYAGYEDFPVL